LNALSDNNGILEYEGKPVSTTGITIDDTETAIDKTWSSNKINSELGKKVTAVAGKQLSTEDYTTDEKSKVATIDAINSAVNNITDKTMNVISTIVVPAGGLMSIEWNNLNNLTHARITALVEKGSNSQAYSFYYVNGVKSGSITTSIVSNAGKSLVAFEFEKHGSIWVQSYKRGNGTILHEVLTGLDMTNIVRITSIKLESYNITQNFPEGSTFVLEGY
jgi:hypothetical protein